MHGDCGSSPGCVSIFSIAGRSTMARDALQLPAAAVPAVLQFQVDSRREQPCAADAVRPRLSARDLALSNRCVFAGRLLRLRLQRHHQLPQCVPGDNQDPKPDRRVMPRLTASSLNYSVYFALRRLLSCLVSSGASSL